MAAKPQLHLNKTQNNTNTTNSATLKGATHSLYLISLVNEPFQMLNTTKVSHLKDVMTKFAVTIFGECVNAPKIE